MWNNRQLDVLFLKSCHDGDIAALTRFNAEGYWEEVAEAIYLVADSESVSPPDIAYIRNLVIACIDKIFQEYEHVPSSLSSLRSRVRKFAVGYIHRYIDEGGRLQW
jgi:hypothetical protein